MEKQSEFLAVTENEGEEAVELPRESDGCLLLSTLQAQFPGASGLKCRNPETNAFRGIRLADGRLYPPTSSQVYTCVFPKAVDSAMEKQSEFLAVTENEGEEAVELPRESDGCLLLSTLQAQFPGASGLKCRNPETNAFRGIRLADGRLYPPTSSQVYTCVFPKDQKRLGDEGPDFLPAKRRKHEKCTDLIVMGIPWSTTDADLKKHFEEYGPLELCTVKRDRISGDSKGYGFIRFQDNDAQIECLETRCSIGGRLCDVQISNTRQQEDQDHIQYSTKVFVGQLPDDITQEELRKHFSQYGTVTDVYMPRPFRSFAFVTFAELDTAQAVLSKEHDIKGRSVTVVTAVPKIPPHLHQQQQMEQQALDPFYPSMANAGGQFGGKYASGGPGAGRSGQGDDPDTARVLNMLSSAVFAALGNSKTHMSGGTRQAGFRRSREDNLEGEQRRRSGAKYDGGSPGGGRVGQGGDSNAASALNMLNYSDFAALRNSKTLLSGGRPATGLGPGPREPSDQGFATFRRPRGMRCYGNYPNEEDY